jgi:hypothetical protein
MPKKIDAVVAGQGLSRRKFGQRAALAGVAAVLGRSVGAAGQGTPAAGNDNNKDEIEARYQRAMQQYGDRLSDAQKARIRKILEFQQMILQPIRSFPLDNSQSTATGLKLYPDPMAGAGEGSHVQAQSQDKKG